MFSFYVLSFIIDLLPAVRTHHHMSHAAVAEKNAYDNGGSLAGEGDFPPAAFERGGTGPGVGSNF